MEAQSPDTFLGNLFDLAPQEFLEILRQQAADMKNPPIDLRALLDGLGKIVPVFAGEVRAYDIDAPRQLP